MPTTEFKDWLFEKFLEWERQQPGKRSSFSAFARYLNVKQQLLSNWIKGPTIPNDENAYKLFLIYGDEVYDVLNRDSQKIDILLAYITANWGKLPPSVQQTIHTQILEYLTRQADESEPSPTSP